MLVSQNSKECQFAGLGSSDITGIESAVSWCVIKLTKSLGPFCYFDNCKLLVDITYIIWLNSTITGVLLLLRLQNKNK